MTDVATFWEQQETEPDAELRALVDGAMKTLSIPSQKRCDEIEIAPSSHPPRGCTQAQGRVHTRQDAAEGLRRLRIPGQMGGL